MKDERFVSRGHCGSGHSLLAVRPLLVARPRRQEPQPRGVDAPVPRRQGRELERSVATRLTVGRREELVPQRHPPLGVEEVALEAVEQVVPVEWPRRALPGWLRDPILVVVGRGGAIIRGGRVQGGGDFGPSRRGRYSANSARWYERICFRGNSEAMLSSVRGIRPSISVVNSNKPLDAF